jgi:hypothetical protein
VTKKVIQTVKTKTMSNVHKLSESLVILEKRSLSLGFGVDFRNHKESF